MENSSEETLSELSPHKKARKDDTESQCSTCARLLSFQGLSDLNSLSGFSHKTSQDLKASIQEGCDLCDFIFWLASKEFGNSWQQDEKLVFWNLKQGKKRNNTHINVLHVGVEGSSEDIKIYPFAKQDDPLSTLIRRRPLCKDVSSSHVFRSARKLIKACIRPDKPSQGHKRCQYSRDVVLPTRVIKISDQIVQLQINEREIKGSYLALSYCWGADDTDNNRLSRLRKNNEQELMNEVKLEELEQSVQDAIYTTRELGFEYLWVDRLCIIQDCKQDKDREISKMATIYKNAAITLAAGTATEASEGFLGNLPNTEAYLPEHKFEIPMEDGRSGTVYLSGRPYQPDHPLDNRGWTLQEYMLSSRMLIFSDYQLLWQCQEVKLQSVTGNGAGIEYQQQIESLPWASFEDEGEPSYGTPDSEKLYLWKTIITQYTRRSMKVSDDRLRAVTGITTELQKVWRDSHIYGHWERWFIQLLAWYKPVGDKVEERHLQRAPSWSWVSVDGGIRYEEPIEVEDIKIEVLTAAKVKLYCRILQHKNIDRSQRGTLSPRSDLVFSAAEKEFGDKKCQYLLLGKSKAYDDGHRRGLGLIVLRTPSGSYRRVGLAVFEDMTVWDKVKHQSVDLEPKEKVSKEKV